MKLTNVISGKSRISSISLAVGAAVLLVWSGSAVRAMEVDEIADLDESELKSFLEAKRQKMLSEISLSANPSKEQVSQYIRKIADASRGDKRQSVWNPQYKLFSRIGREHLDLLLLNVSDPDIKWYCVRRIRNIATEQDKAKIIEWLEAAPKLAEVVTKHGWAADAKPVLVKHLSEHPTWLPSEWIRAVVQLRDPATYADLKWYLLHGKNNDRTYRALKDAPGLPGFDIEDVLKELWTQTKNWSPRQRRYLATIAPAAVEHGILDALAFTVNLLDEEGFGGRYVLELPGDRRHTPREVVLRYTDARGTNEELRRWFLENKEKLVFDPKSKKFQVGNTDR